MPWGGSWEGPPTEPAFSSECSTVQRALPSGLLGLSATVACTGEPSEVFLSGKGCLIFAKALWQGSTLASLQALSRQWTDAGLMLRVLSSPPGLFLGGEFIAGKKDQSLEAGRETSHQSHS